MSSCEKWKTLCYQGEIYDQFEVSSQGKLKNVKTGTIYKLHVNYGGYCQVCVSLGSKKNKKVFRVHEAVAETFIPNPENKPEVNHKNGDKQNNCVTNLEWVTHSENMKHAYQNGLIRMPCGVNNPTAKFTKEDVEFIRNNYIPGDIIYGSRGLGRMFGVSHTLILDIVKRRTYKDV